MDGSIQMLVRPSPFSADSRQLRANDSLRRSFETTTNSTCARTRSSNAICVLLSYIRYPTGRLHGHRIAPTPRSASTLRVCRQAPEDALRLPEHRGTSRSQVAARVDDARIRIQRVTHRAREHDVETRTDVDLADTRPARGQHDVVPDAGRTVQYQRHGNARPQRNDQVEVEG